MSDERGQYIEKLLATEEPDLPEFETDVLNRMRAIEAQGNQAANDAKAFRQRALQLDNSVKNAQGRFDALADILYDYEEDSSSCLDFKGKTIFSQCNCRNSLLGIC